MAFGSMSIGTPGSTGYVGPKVSAMPSMAAPSGGGVVYRPIASSGPTLATARMDGPSQSDINRAIWENAAMGMLGTGARDVMGAIEGNSGWGDVVADVGGVLAAPLTQGTPLSAGVMAELGKAGLDYFGGGGNPMGHLENAAWGAGGNLASQALAPVLGVAAGPVVGGAIQGFRAANAFSDTNPNASFMGENVFSPGATAAGLTAGGRGLTSGLAGAAVGGPLGIVASWLAGKLFDSVAGSSKDNGFIAAQDALISKGLSESQAAEVMMSALTGGGAERMGELERMYSPGYEGSMNFAGPVDIGYDTNLGFDMGVYGQGGAMDGFYSDAGWGNLGGDFGGGFDLGGDFGSGGMDFGGDFSGSFDLGGFDSGFNFDAGGLGLSGIGGGFGGGFSGGSFGDMGIGGSFDFGGSGGTGGYFGVFAEGGHVKGNE